MRLNRSCNTLDGGGMFTKNGERLKSRTIKETNTGEERREERRKARARNWDESLVGES